MSDPLVTYSILCGSALVAGVVNAVAGGGTLLTFPALAAVLAATMSHEDASVTANQTSTVALVVGSFAGFTGYRSELVGAGPWLRLLAGPSIFGAVAGSLVLILFPAKVFDAVIPWLILLASMLFLLQPYIAPAGEPADGSPANAAVPHDRAVGAVFFQFLVAMYGGYFGAGIGILMLANFAMLGVGDIHRMNGLKAGLAALINGISVVVFVATPLFTPISGTIHWPYAGAMGAAAVAGGLVGSHTAKRLDRNLVRALVILIGFGLSGWYFYRQFGR
jgi:hypothetical protein